MTQTKKHDTPLLPLEAYNRQVQSGAIADDPAQRDVALMLDNLYTALMSNPTAKESSWRFWSGKKTHNVPNLYIWGEVGRGKTMLMDMFFDALPEGFQAERIHYHAFMSDIHTRLHSQRQQAPQGHDPLAIVAAKYISNLRVLCIDEFQVHDIADAMILSRLFTMLLNAGLTVVATSNRPPEDLYLHGLQREKFLDFIALVRARFNVAELASPKDYRMQKLKGHGSYFMPGDNLEELRALFESLISHEPKETILHVKGRDLALPYTADGVAWCSFDMLCRAALGADDYTALAAEFHTIFLVNVPRMGREDRNEAKRFVTLIDVLYEHRVNLLCSANTPPETLYPQGDGNFEFQRTVSRLHEMQSDEYRKRAHEV